MAADQDSGEAAHRMCAALVCTAERQTDIRLTGFEDTVDGEWIGLCPDHYRDVQLGFIRGDARATVSLMLGLLPPGETPDDL